MVEFWRRVLFFPSILFLCSLLIWTTVGAQPALLFFALLLLVRHTLFLHQFVTLEKWLIDPEGRVPEGAGLWEDVFTRLNQLDRKSVV